MDGGRGKKPVKRVGDPLVMKLAMKKSMMWKNARRVSASETVALPGLPTQNKVIEDEICCDSIYSPVV